MSHRFQAKIFKESCEKWFKSARAGCRVFNMDGSGGYQQTLLWLESSEILSLPLSKLCIPILRDEEVSEKFLPDLGGQDTSKNRYEARFSITDLSFEKLYFAWARLIFSIVSPLQRLCTPMLRDEEVSEKILPVLGGWDTSKNRYEARFPVR